MSETTVNEAAAAAPAPKPKRPKAKSMIMMGEQTAAMFENARLAKEKGEPVGWSASIFPQEIAETLFSIRKTMRRELRPDIRLTRSCRSARVSSGIPMICAHTQKLISPMRLF